MFRKSLPLLISVAVLMLCGCATPVPDDPEYENIEPANLPQPDLSIRIPGLGPCTSNENREIWINTREPIIVLVHGCYGSAARFRALAQVFAFHGQQAVCFSYNDRDSMMNSSAELINALDRLSSVSRNEQITVIAHSQGGLIARKALVKDRQSHWNAGDSNLKLITISAPFSGIASASLCVSRPNILLSLGLALPVCRLVSGDKWFEITRYSDFVTAPGNLIDQVYSHLKIVTDERGSCRRRASDGHCLEDDYVFSLEEQYMDLVDQLSLVNNLEVRAGHSEIVGDHRMPPSKLIDILQNRGIMQRTMPSQRASFERLLAKLY